MRIIKFRGKSLNTKMWVYGDLNHRGKRTFIEYEVDCKTIGQFIGKTDKEGTEIYEHDQNDDNAYFMVINAPNTEVHLITGEIGICSLLTGQRGHFELPRVSYQTSKGKVVLFPDEIMPVDINLLQQEINEGYIMLSDGRYLPPKEAVQQCYNAFGIRVGLGDNWEDIYDGWNKEMK